MYIFPVFISKGFHIFLLLLFAVIVPLQGKGLPSLLPFLSGLYRVPPDLDREDSMKKYFSLVKGTYFFHSKFSNHCLVKL